jgi:hypothetical protein
MADGSKSASLERSRSLETAVGELANSFGRQLEEIRNELVSELRTLERSARVKDFIVILAIRNVKERLRQRVDPSNRHEVSFSAAVPATRSNTCPTQLEALR